MLLNVSVEDAVELRSRLNIREGAGRLRLAGRERLPIGTSVVVDAWLRAPREMVRLHGSVAARRFGEAPGVWIAVPAAELAIESCEIGLSRQHRRWPDEHLALLETRDGLVLCRARDLSEGGARLLVSGVENCFTNVTFLDARGEVDVHGRVAWQSATEVGIEWADLDRATRAELRRLVRDADVPWRLAG